MRQLRRVRPLCWFLLAVFGVIIACWNSWSWQFTATSSALHILYTALLLLHMGIYWLVVTVKMRREFTWLLIASQAGLILLLTQLTQLVIMALVLSLVLFIVVTLTCKQLFAVLATLASYLALLLLYMQTFDPGQEWQAMWSGGYAPEIALLGLFFLLVLMLYLQREQHAHEQTKTLLHKLDTAHAQLSAYALRVEELTMTTERQRIARDLHDTFIQGVTGLVMQLEVAQTQLHHHKVERAQEILEQVMEAAHDTIADARCAIGNLRTECMRPDDLLEEVQEEISRFTAATDIPCQSDLTQLSTIPSALCEQVLRVIAEGLANVAHHAHAHSVWVQVMRQNGMLTIEVRDDGVGFDAAAVSTQVGHYGLFGLRERAKLVGGSIEIRSGVGKGTTLHFNIPEHAPIQLEGEARWHSASVS